MGGGRHDGAVLEGPAAELLAGRYSLVVALVGEGLVPHATRGWGLTALPGPPTRFRLVLGVDDAPWLGDGPTPRAIALTVGDPRTLRSLQMKGRVGPAAPATDDDLAAVVRFCASFFSVVEEVDGTERRLLELLVPTDFVACTVDVEDLYDQTPGPGAGAPLPEGPS